MKNELKRLLALGLISVLVFIGCPNDSSGKGPPVCGEGCECEKCDGEECDCNKELDPNLPKEQSVEISPFDEASSATVTGHMTDTQWEGVADTIKRHVDSSLERAFFGSEDVVIEAFSREGGIVFDVEIEPTEFVNWKTTGDGRTISIALSAIDVLDVIDISLTSAILNQQTVAQALPCSRDNYREFRAAQRQHQAAAHVAFKNSRIVVRT
jgi:hypothetical protein